MMIKGSEKYSQRFDQYMNSNENLSQTEGVIRDRLQEILIDECVLDCASCRRIWTNTSIINHRIICHCKLCVNATQENQAGGEL